VSIRIGTAAWAIPNVLKDRFSEQGSALQRYSERFDSVEINSTFYRSHRTQTYVRWAQNTPAQFRFSAKLPRAITHILRLRNAGAALAAFLAEVTNLGDKLGPILVQLPPSLVFDPVVAGRFFTDLRTLTKGPVVCEPRHSTWFDSEADAFLTAHQIARAAVDPALHSSAAQPGGWPGLAYWRLHGSPRIYYSDYPQDFLADLSKTLNAGIADDTWCIFDNTALGSATANALALVDLLSRSAG
jgi:uncharacterized protein YecE (DUF72 family)